jgi:DNA-directed RNA polymerase I, II, and III subunit RPABC1
MYTDIARLYRITKTVYALLEDRGFIVPQEVSSKTLAEFSAGLDLKKNHSPSLYRQGMTYIASHTKTDAQIFVFYAAEERIGVKQLKGYVDDYMEKLNQGVARAILITKGTITPYAKQVIAQMAPMKIIEHFKETELLVNITEHILVPKHILLSEEQKQALLTKYKLKPNQLPCIQEHDPVARYYGLQKGEVVKIIRPSETAGRYVTYRRVV